MSSSEIESKRRFHALQTDEKVDIIFWVLAFRVKRGVWPTLEQVKEWWSG